MPHKRADKYIELVNNKWPREFPNFEYYMDTLDDSFYAGLNDETGFGGSFDNCFKVYEEIIKSNDPDCYILIYFLVMFYIRFGSIGDRYTKEKHDYYFKYGLNCALKVANNRDLVRYLYPF